MPRPSVAQTIQGKGTRMNPAPQFLWAGPQGVHPLPAWNVLCRRATVRGVPAPWWGPGLNAPARHSFMGIHDGGWRYGHPRWVRPAWTHLVSDGPTPHRLPGPTPDHSFRSCGGDVVVHVSVQDVGSEGAAARGVLDHRGTDNGSRGDAPPARLRAAPRTTVIPECPPVSPSPVRCRRRRNMRPANTSIPRRPGSRSSPCLPPRWPGGG